MENGKRNNYRLKAELQECKSLLRENLQIQRVVIECEKNVSALCETRDIESFGQDAKREDAEWEEIMELKTIETDLMEDEVACVYPRYRQALENYWKTKVLDNIYGEEEEPSLMPVPSSPIDQPFSDEESNGERDGEQDDSYLPGENALQNLLQINLRPPPTSEEELFVDNMDISDQLK